MDPRWSSGLPSAPCNSANREPIAARLRSAATGLDYMLARYYSSSLARFMAADPGDDTALEDPQSWNKYAYVRNNPVNATDPTGEFGLLGAAIGAGVEVGFQMLVEGRSLSDIGHCNSCLARIAVSALAGATGVGAASVISRVTADVVERGALNAVAGMAIGAAAGATSTAASNVVEGQPVTEGVGQAAAVGAIGGTGGSVLGSFVGAGVTAGMQAVGASVPAGVGQTVQNASTAVGEVAGVAAGEVLSAGTGRTTPSEPKPQQQRPPANGPTP